ncbi:MAG: CDP-alcohol phosphatidyltransferase family protein [Candidatus Aegiribacteria sp.]|nr:CDP-alcohol phosphatidyltransferase family protein [Candidatus Aegiribacteria sp.]
MTFAVSILHCFAEQIPGGLFNLENIRNAGRKLLFPLVSLLAAIGMGPFSVTTIGLLMTAVAACFIWDGNFIAGVAFFIVGSILDAVDGELARRKNAESVAGAVFDSCCDRIGEVLIFGALLAGKAGEAHHVMVYLVPAAIGGSFMVSYIRARAEGLDLSCSVGLFTRTERLVLLMAGLVAAGLWDTQALVIMLIVLAAGSWFTAGQRFAKVIRDGRGISLNKE